MGADYGGWWLGLWICLELYGGFLEWGYPNSWLVFGRENPTKIRMMTGGTPILGTSYGWLYGFHKQRRIDLALAIMKYGLRDFLNWRFEFWWCFLRVFVMLECPIYIYIHILYIYIYIIYIYMYIVQLGLYLQSDFLHGRWWSSINCGVFSDQPSLGCCWCSSRSFGKPSGWWVVHKNFKSIHVFRYVKPWGSPSSNIFTPS